MDCREVAELAPLYLTGEIDAARAAAMDAHLQSCPPCLRELERLARSDLRFRDAVLSGKLRPTQVIQRVRERIANGSGSTSLRRSLLRTPLRRVAAFAGSAVALVVLAAGFWLGRAPRPAEVCSDAANDHRTEVVNSEPRQWLSDHAKIATLALRQGISSATVPTQVLGDYRLARGRLCFLDRHIFLHLVYSNGRQEVSLYLRSRDGLLQGSSFPNAGQEIPVARAGADRAHVASFETPSLTAVVVASESSGAALQFAQAVSTKL